MAHASILLLEDDPQIRDLLTEVLISDGYPVHTCASVDDLRQVGSAGEFTLAIVDAWGESYNALSEVERREIQDVARTIPTVMVTARRWAQTTVPAELGLLALVGKPFDLDELLALVKQCIERLLQDSADARAAARQLRRRVVDAHHKMSQVSRRLDEINQSP
jgi:DNA-binding NtrC family response regulator